MCVIVMIVIFASVVFPSLSFTRENARQVGCLNNLSQIALAAGFYTSDFGSFFMPKEGGGGRHYPGQLIQLGYTGQGDIFLCPSMPGPRLSVAGYNVGETFRNAKGGDRINVWVSQRPDYGYNHDVLALNKYGEDNVGSQLRPDGTLKPPARFGQLSNPSKTILMVETAYGEPDASRLPFRDQRRRPDGTHAGYSLARTRFGTGGALARAPAFPAHDDYAVVNVLWADGSARGFRNPDPGAEPHVHAPLYWDVEDGGLGCWSKGFWAR